MTTEIVVGFKMKHYEAFQFFLDALNNSSQFRLVKGNRDTFKMQLTMLVQNGKPERHLNLTISDKGETCDLHFTAARLDDIEKLAQMSQAMLGVIAEYGQKSRSFWTNKILAREATHTEVQQVETFLKAHPMSTVEEISDALVMLQFTVADSLSKLPEGRLQHTQPKYFLK